MVGGAREPFNIVSSIPTFHFSSTRGELQTVIEDVKTRVTKFLGQEVPVMTLLWNIYRIIVIYAVKEKIKKMNDVRNALTPVPGYLFRQIRTSSTLTCVKTPVRPLANIARPASIRNIVVVPRTE